MPHIISAMLTCSLLAPALLADETPRSSDLVRVAVDQLLTMQESEGDWPYEGVYRVRGKIPVGYRIGGTAIVSTALLHATTADQKNASAAIDKGVAFILDHLGDRLMSTSTEDRYDVRVWGHTYALLFFCDLLNADRAGRHTEAVKRWVPRLTETLITEQLDDGGWNYATRKRHAVFVTSSVVQSLMMAKARGMTVSGDVFAKARECLLASRKDDGAFLYTGRFTKEPRKSIHALLPGSIARSCIAETTIRLLGAGSVKDVQASLDAFHTHWDELEKRRKKTGTHTAPYGVAPYYFYFGHRYAAQAIQMLPEKDRPAERKRFLEVILRTRDPDGTWNDRVFPRSKNFGTAMILMALLEDAAPLPPAYTG